MTDLNNIHRLSVGAMKLIEEIDRIATGTPREPPNDLCVHPRDAFPVDDKPIKINTHDIFAKTPTRPALQRPISSLEELENLPEYAIVIDQDKRSWQRGDHDVFYCCLEARCRAYALYENYAPLTLIYQPEDNE